MPTLLLDVDGVLVSGRPADGKHLFTDLERDVGVSLPRLQREFFDKSWHGIVTGKKPLLPALAEALLRIAPAVSAQTLLDYWLRNDARIDQTLLAAVAHRRSNGWRVYLATNQEHHRARYLMEDLALGSHVDGIFYSAALGARKPDRGFFEAVATTIDDPASIFIDDTEANVLAARRFGWRAIQWQFGMELEEQLERAQRLPAPG
jgi:putative hydrolase of the HAD superfamily